MSGSLRLRRGLLAERTTTLLAAALVAVASPQLAACGSSESGLETPGVPSQDAAAEGATDAGTDAAKDAAKQDAADAKPDQATGDAPLDVTPDTAPDVQEAGSDGEADAAEAGCMSDGPELCNGVDDDCDGQVDEEDPGGGGTCATGLDGICATGLEHCIKGVVSCVPDHGPGEVAESCNGLDDDCDGMKDEGLPTSTYFKDDDGDGFGTTASLEACAKPTGYADKSGDCNDNNVEIAPNVAEVCNEVDDDCNGAIDNGLPQQNYYLDNDDDGYGTTSMIKGCKPSPGYVDKPGDCNDNNILINPAGVEQCNDIDENCNGVVDEGVQKPTFYKDNDGDGWGGTTSTLACTAPAGYVAESGDCNDFNKNTYPFATEQCNNIDDDCDGAIDNDVVTQKIYKDNDGDGFAPPNALSQDKCDVPVGWTPAKDVNADGVDDWDCNDSDVTVFPGASEVCGDGKDNACSGYVDRLCFSTCAGTWPFKLDFTNGAPMSQIADLDGDGKREIIIQDAFGFGILSSTGTALFEHSAAVHNYSRNYAALADIDNYDQHGAAVQSLEVLTGNGSVPRFYKLNANSTVTEYTGTDGVYDASDFLVADVDRDGVIEFFTTSWCNAAQGTRVFRFDRGTGAITNVVDIADPNSTCEYTDGRILTDLDGDGKLELVFGNGYAYATAPSQWAGNIFAQAFTDPTTLANEPFCAAGTCFPTSVAGLFGGAMGYMFRIGDQIRGGATLFTTNTPDVSNPSTSYYYAFDLAGTPILSTPSQSFNIYSEVSDVDNDGTPENYSDVLRRGLFDLNNDGFPDRVYVSGTELRVDLWNATDKKFVEHQASRRSFTSAGGSFGAVWDLDGDGMIEAITSDAAGNVYCHKLGKDTWNKATSQPAHVRPFYRTNQFDPYEPNEGADTNADGMPDQITRVPSALTAKGDFYGYLSSAADKDYYLIDSDWGGSICVEATGGRVIDLEVYSYLDRWDNVTHATPADGVVDGLIWESTTDATKKCFYGSNVVPYRYGEYRFVIGVKSHAGSFSPHWPYWITATK